MGFGLEVVPLWRVLLMLEHIESKANSPQEILSLCKAYSKIMALDSSVLMKSTLYDKEFERTIDRSYDI